MAALIRQANSRYKLANKPKIKKKKLYGGREERENKTMTTTNKHFLISKRRQEMSASNVTKAGYT